MRWVPPLGALGAATGAIAIGTVATLRSTTIIITIRTTISTATSAARDRVIGSTIRNTAEMLRMETGKQPISLAVRGLEIVPAVRVALVVPEDPVAPVALVVQENPVVLAARVVPESPAVPVALELQTVPVAVPERELDQVAVVLVRDHPHDRLALPVETKSVTAAHRPDLVPLLVAEDLAVAAETTLEPVAAEAVIAWAAAE